MSTEHYAHDYWNQTQQWKVSISVLARSNWGYLFWQVISIIVGREPCRTIYRQNQFRKPYLAKGRSNRGQRSNPQRALSAIPWFLYTPHCELLVADTLVGRRLAPGLYHSTCRYQDAQAADFLPASVLLQGIYLPYLDRRSINARLRVMMTVFKFIGFSVVYI